MRFHLDPQQLSTIAGENRHAYAAAKPFPHAVFDNFFDEAVLDAVLAEFPPPAAQGWVRFESENERKLATQEVSDIGPQTLALLTELNSAPFLDFLCELTGISGLVADPYFRGGGMHQIVRGGHLNIHVDFNKDARTGLDRRLNVLLYLNRDWQPEWGGALELWNRDMTSCEERILPLFNRLVVFSTTEHSFHGHPTPLACPEDRSRRSLALYYYTVGRPGENGGPSDLRNTVWAEPRDPAEVARERRRELVRRLTPPILLDAVKAARRNRA
jgi:hypothetical protein